MADFSYHVAGSCLLARSSAQVRARPVYTEVITHLYPV